LNLLRPRRELLPDFGRCIFTRRVSISENSHVTPAELFNIIWEQLDTSAKRSHYG
jgi:hypothetical protein